MPLYVTVTPGTTVTASTVLDPTVLNLLGNPAIDINGTVDGGSLSLAAGSVTTTALAARSVTFPKIQAIGTDRLLGRDTSGSGDVEELTVSGGLGFTGVGGIEITNGQVAYAKIVPVAASRLLGNPTGSSATMSEIPLGAGLAFQDGALVNTASAKYRADFSYYPSYPSWSYGVNAADDQKAYPDGNLNQAIYRTTFVPSTFQLSIFVYNCPTFAEGSVGFQLQYKADAGAWTNAAGGLLDVKGLTSQFTYASSSLSFSPSPSQILWRLLWVNTTGEDISNLVFHSVTLSLWN